ncbi:hypothetical protein [Nigerium sp.]
MTCQKCGKTTWAGCGQHVAQVRAGVAPGQWCTCERTPSGGFLSRLLGR